MELEVDEVEGSPSLVEDDDGPEDSGGGEKQEKQDDKGSKGASADDVKAMMARLEAIEKERDELRESERYWSEKARAGEKPKEDEVEDKDDLSDLFGDLKDGDDGDSDKFIDELTGEGAAALRKRGFVTKKEAIELARAVAERVAEKASKKAVGVAEKKLQRDSQLLKEFPFIDQEDSEGFKLTGEYFRKAVARNPARANDPDALWDAADKAKTVLEERRKAEEAKGGKKRARIAAQADFGGTSGMGDDDDEMSALERDVANKFGVSEAEYRRHRTVNIAGFPGMRG